MIKSKYDGKYIRYVNSKREIETIPLVKHSVFTLNELVVYHIPIDYTIPVMIEKQKTYFFFGLRFIG